MKNYARGYRVSNQGIGDELELGKMNMLLRLGFFSGSFFPLFLEFEREILRLFWVLEYFNCFFRNNS